MSTPPTTGRVGRYDALVVPTPRRARITTRNIDNERLAWADDHFEPTYLDPVAAMVFDVLDGVATLAELSEDVESAAGVDPAVAEYQIDRIISILDAGKLIEPVLARIPMPSVPNESPFPDPDW